MAKLKLNPKRTALLIQDLQNDVIIEKGAFADSGAPQHAKEQNVVANVKRLAAAFRKAGAPVIHVWYIVEKGAPGLKLNAPLFEGVAGGTRSSAGTWGAKPAAGLEPKRGDFVVEKMRMSALAGHEARDAARRPRRRHGRRQRRVDEHVDRAHRPHRRRQGLLHGRPGGLLLDDERRLAQRVDQLRAPERVDGDRRQDGRRRARRVKSRAAVFHGAGQPLEVREIELDEPRPSDVARADVGGRDLRHRAALDPRRVGAADPVGARARGRGGGRGGRRRRSRRCSPATRSCSPGRRRAAIAADCRRGRPAACINLHRAIGNGTLVDGTTGMTIDGETLYRGTATGCLQERITVTERCALPIGGGVSLEEAALLGCAAMTGVGAVLFAARTEPGETVLVIGAGGVGQFCVQGARIAGAAAIVVVDPLEARLELARELGATHTTGPDGLKELMKEIAPDGADRALDVVGNPETTATALRFTRSGGTCVIVGIPATGERLDLDFGEFNRREKFLTGTMYGSEDPAVALPMLLDHARAGRLQLRELLGPSFPLEQVNEAFDASLAGVAGRVLVSPEASRGAARRADLADPAGGRGRTSRVLRAMGHEPVGVLCVRATSRYGFDLGDHVTAAPPELDVVMPAVARADRAAAPGARAGPRPLRRLPLEAARRGARGSAARRGEHPPVAAAALPRPDPGRLGDPERRPRDRHDLPPDGRRARHRADPRPGDDAARRRVVVGRARATHRRTSCSRSSRSRSSGSSAGDPGDPQDESAASTSRSSSRSTPRSTGAGPRAEIARQVRAWRFGSAGRRRAGSADRARR